MELLVNVVSINIQEATGSRHFREEMIIENNFAKFRIMHS